MEAATFLALLLSANITLSIFAVMTAKLAKKHAIHCYDLASDMLKECQKQTDKVIEVKKKFLEHIEVSK